MRLNENDMNELECRFSKINGKFMKANENVLAISKLGYDNVEQNEQLDNITKLIDVLYDDVNDFSDFTNSIIEKSCLKLTEE
jgi:hypothetical protein